MLLFCFVVSAPYSQLSSVLLERVFIEGGSRKLGLLHLSAMEGEEQRLGPPGLCLSLQPCSYGPASLSATECAEREI